VLNPALLMIWNIIGVKCRKKRRLLLPVIDNILNYEM
jgi:hypothetical protein